MGKNDPEKSDALNGAVELPMWQLAFSYAARAHRGQFRRDKKTPYVAHVMRVAMTVRDVFGCEDQIAITAAALHDVIEDTGADYDDIQSRFGREVADAVVALTKNMMLPEDERERDYDRRLASADWRARLVKLADVYDNGHDRMDEMKLGKIIDRCDRALALAAVDADARAETRRAIEAVRRVRNMLAGERSKGRD